MRVTSPLRRRLTGVLAVSLACAVLGACGNETKNDAAASSSAASVKVPVGMEEVEIPADFPDRMPRPKAPHVVVTAQGKDPGWILMAAYAERTNLEAELVHFRADLKEKGFTIEETKPLAAVEGSPGMKQAAVLARDDERMLHVALTQAKDEQPVVSVTSWGGELTTLDQ